MPYPIKRFDPVAGSEHATPQSAITLFNGSGHTRPQSTIALFDSLPDGAHIRMAQLAELLGISEPTGWRWLAAKKLPMPVKLSPRITAFRVGDVRQWLEARHVERHLDLIKK